jgi:CBS domain-containing protein
MQVFKVDQWMNRNVVTITKDRPVFDAADLMRRHNIGCIVVIDNDEPIGIITERDLVRKVTAKRKDPNTTLVEDVMSINVVTIDAGVDIKEVSDKMVKYNIKKMPVVENHKIRGIVTSTDIVRVLSEFNKLYDAKEIIQLGI